MAKRKLNVRLIRKIIKHITEKPNRYLQERFIRTGTPGTPLPGTPLWSGNPQVFAECGTVACIGGWAYILSRPRPKLQWWPRRLYRGALAMGLTPAMAEVLFAGAASRTWPKPYGRNYFNATTPHQKAKVAASLLEKVIETKGAILETE